MCVLLSFCLAFKALSDQSHGGDEGLIDDVFGRAGAGVASIDQLDDAHCGRNSQRRQFEEAMCRLHLGFFEAQASAFERPEDLFNTPALTVDMNDFPRIRLAINRQAGQ